jgi:hypothetical protein
LIPECVVGQHWRILEAFPSWRGWLESWWSQQHLEFVCGWFQSLGNSVETLMKILSSFHHPMSQYERLQSLDNRIRSLGMPGAAQKYPQYRCGAGRQTCSALLNWGQTPIWFFGCFSSRSHVNILGSHPPVSVASIG